MEGILILMFPMCIALAGCGSMNGEPPHGTPADKSEFLNEFAERTGPALAIHDDGMIEYKEMLNNHCRLEYSGRIEIVQNDGNSYDVTYRYTALNVSHRTCRQRDTSCVPDFQACQIAETKGNAEIGKLKNRKINKGSPPSSVQLPPIGN
jgi:hypothetical protein